MTFAIFNKDGFTKLGEISTEGKVVTKTDGGLMRATQGWLFASVEEWVRKNGWRIKQVPETTDIRRR